MRMNTMAYLIRVPKDSSVTKGVELLLRLAHKGIQTRLHVGQFVADVIEEDLKTPHKRAIRP